MSIVSRVFLLAFPLWLAGCATGPVEPRKVERLTGESLAALLPQPVAALSLDEIVKLSRQGMPAEEIISRVSSTHSRYRLSASQLLELRQRGVDMKVLDHLVESERRAIFDEMAVEIGKREKACSERITQEVQQCRLQSHPGVWSTHPLSTCWPPIRGFPYWRCF